MYLEENVYSEQDFDNDWENSIFTESAIVDDLWNEYEKKIQDSFEVLEAEIEDYIYCQKISQKE